MGSIQNAIGLWLCRYVFIYPLPMPSVLRAPRTPRVPQRPGSSFFKLSRSCLPRRRRCQDLLLFNLRPPSHTELQHQPHTHANLPPPPSQVTRYALTTPSAYHRLERACAANIVSVLRPQSKHRTRTILELAPSTRGLSRTPSDHQPY
jgi:hypothetical protein